MRPCKKVVYLTLEDYNAITPFTKQVMSNFLMWILNLDDAEDLADYQIPSDLTTNASIYNEFLSLVLGRYDKEYFIKVTCVPPSEWPTNDEIDEAARKWGFNFLSLLNLTYEYYVPLLTFYRSAKTNLMDDITATSSNSIKFNDTPQNANTSGVYEGDDYISQYTKTEGTSTTPLTTKINRLKEIQEGYKNVMADWVKDFEKLFMEAQHYEGF